MSSLTTIRGKRKLLQWLSCLAWQAPREKDAEKKRRRWKEFHRRKKERKIMKKALTAQRIGVCVPPPPPEEEHELRARRALSSAAPFETLVALRSLKTEDGDVESLRWLMRCRVSGLSSATYEAALRVTGIDDVLVSRFALDNYRLVARDLPEPEPPSPPPPIEFDAGSEDLESYYERVNARFCAPVFDVEQAKQKLREENTSLVENLVRVALRAI